MKKVRKISLFAFCAAAALLLGACSNSIGSGPRYIPRPDIPLSQYTPANWAEDEYDRVAYNQYEHREQCQNYRRIPRNSMQIGGCDVYIMPAVPAVALKAEETMTSVVTTIPPPVVPAPVVAPAPFNHTLYFDWDKYNVRASERATLDEIVRRINAYNYRQIQIVGHADRSGPVSYNQTLSENRANAVSNALVQRGIAPGMISTSGRGELQPAVPTADGVRLQENRRVVVDLQ